MKDIGFLIGFFVLLGLLSISVGKNGGIFGNATSTTSYGTSSSTLSQGSSYYNTSTNPPEAALSEDEVEQRISTIYSQLDILSEDLRKEKLREPKSPYAGLVSLQYGNPSATDPDQEYLLLYANSSNTSDIDISNWYLESYVTEKRAAIPQGARFLNGERSENASDIYLEPGEEAYLVTAAAPEPPNISFHENTCTGYLQAEHNFYPWISQECPDPVTEMQRFANIDLDNDPCYDFVQNINRCQPIDEDSLKGTSLSRGCQQFVLNDLNYSGCYLNHHNDPLFEDVGHWWVYLDRNKELWRSEREIIRLMDEHDRVIDVIEY